MKKHILNITGLNITNTTDITIIKRNTIIEIINDEEIEKNGVLINTIHNTIHYTLEEWNERVLPNDYNNNNLYIRNRIVSIIPESTSTNTIITNDGLIGVLYTVGANIYLTIVDLFERGTEDYDAINPSDYISLINHLTYDPIKKRTFSCVKENGKLVASNTLIYVENGNAHFYSEMDYPDLPTDEYGYYKAPTISSWNEVPITAAGPRNNRDTTILSPVLGNTYFATDELKLYTYTEDWDDGVTVTSAGPIANRITLIPTPIPGNTYFATNESKLYEYINSWNSTYNKIVDFSFLKKQFIVLELFGLNEGESVEFQIKSGTNAEGVELTELDISTETVKIYSLKYLSVSTNDRYVTLNLIPIGTINCSVRIY
jgi:hypothetical protein